MNQILNGRQQLRVKLFQLQDKVQLSRDVADVVVITIYVFKCIAFRKKIRRLS